jgi:hypothetical protein
MTIRRFGTLLGGTALLAAYPVVRVLDADRQPPGGRELLGYPPLAAHFTRKREPAWLVSASTMRVTAADGGGRWSALGEPAAGLS